MKTLILTLSLSAFCYFFSYSQTDKVFGLYWDQSKDMEYFAYCDLSTGKVKDISKLPDIKYNVTGSKALDYINNQYVISTNLGITIIDIEKGKILDTINYKYSFNFFEFDSVTNKIYGLYWDKDSSIEYFASLDLSTNTINTISKLPGVSAIDISSSALDYKNNQYVIGTNLGITVIDIYSGKILNTYPSIFNFGSFEYESRTNKIYGTYGNPSTLVTYFASLDLATGNIITIDSLPGVDGVAVGSNTLDKNNQLYIIRTNLGITTIDINNGKILNTYKPVFNFGEFEYNQTITSNLSQEALIKLGPNPAVNELNIASDFPINKISIFNNLGSKVQENNFQDMQDISIGLSGLRKGVYFIVIENESEKVIKKLLIEK